MIFNRATEVAIQALLFLAQQGPGKLSPTRAIAAAVDVPEAFLAKVLQRLSASGFVRAFRGSGKGVELGRSAKEIRLSSVVIATQGGLLSDRCILNLKICSDTNPCPLHYEWLPHKKAMEEMLERTTIADLVELLREPPPAPLAPELSQAGKASAV
ncbi:MAG TPA: Rrf2 family transcriptional regulator [Terriglobia bacterium]|nr:Rrf2 family transcriptional regulator [Terriglobia bacterium]